jgi:hypothetical protein
MRVAKKYQNMLDLVGVQVRWDREHHLVLPVHSASDHSVLTVYVP